MKKILLLLLFTVPVLAQDGFKMENGVVVWQRFYNTPNVDVKSFIQANEKLSITSDADNMFVGVGTDVPNTCSSGSVLMKCNTNFSFTIMPVADGYMVRVHNFMFLERYGPMQMRIVQNGLGKYYVERGKIRNTPKTQTDLACVDSFLTGVFSPGAIASEGSGLTAN